MAFQLGGRRAMAEINVTPMVDVVLVLLIIFMVAAPMIQQGVPVALPTAQAQSLPNEEQHAVLSLTSARTVFLGESEIPLAELKVRLQGNLKLQREQQLYLHADRNLPYGFVVDVMAAVQAAGISNLGMVTDPAARSH